METRHRRTILNGSRDRKIIRQRDVHARNAQSDPGPRRLRLQPRISGGKNVSRRAHHRNLRRHQRNSKTGNRRLGAKVLLTRSTLHFDISCALSAAKFADPISYLLCFQSFSRPPPAVSITHFRKNPYPPTPPYFAMYMQIKDLQRSVVDRCANKGLSEIF